MATVKSVGKSGFLKEFFVDHPDTDKAAIDEAWQEAGNEDTISGSLIYKVRSDLGLTGKGIGKARARGGAGASARPPDASPSGVRTGPPRPAAPRASRASEAGDPAISAGGDQTGVLLALEARIDELLLETRAAGGLAEFEELLRKARRILARTHGG